MISALKSQQYARMIRDFSAKEQKAYIEYLLKEGTVEEFFEKMEKHGDHDQSEHGNWSKGGNGSSDKTSEYPTKKSNPELANILKDYIVEYPDNNGHQMINGRLRGTIDAIYTNLTPKAQKELDEAIESLDKLVELSPQLTEPTTAYRGIGTNFAMTLQGKGIGTTFQDNGFVSVSLDKKIAGGFPSRPTGNMMEIVLPKGIKAINPSKFWTSNKIEGTELRREKELILGRGTKFEILSIENSPMGVGNLFKVGIKQ